MQIVSEIKVKVFAQYLFSPVMIVSTGTKGIVEMNVLNLVNIGSDDFKIILKPLSKISDEDAIEIGGFFNHISEIVDYWKKENSFILRYGKGKEVNKSVTIYFDGHVSYLKDGGSSLIRGHKFLKIHQYLQGKGYDLPHYLLGGKTLQEAGLAIYE